MPNNEEMVTVEAVVTQQLVDIGMRHVCSQCPVALAINEHLKPSARSHVGTKIFGIWTKDAGRDYELPRQAQEFISAYDNDLAVALPYSFPISLPKRFVKEAA